MLSLAAIAMKQENNSVIPRSLESIGDCQHYMPNGGRIITGLSQTITLVVSDIEKCLGIQEVEG